jgi:hypothetical protein
MQGCFKCGRLDENGVMLQNGLVCCSTCYEKMCLSKQPKRVPGWEAENSLAIANGFTCRKDAHRGYGWCAFVKNSITVWRVRDGWHRKIDGKTSFVIMRHNSLEDALLGINGNEFANLKKHYA